MNVKIILGFILVILGLKDATGHWCHKCKGSDNESCLGRAQQCTNGQFCASTFEQNSMDEVTMVRKRCATKCPEPNVLICNKRQTKCTYCCHGEGCNRSIFATMTTDDDGDVSPASEPCYLPVCLDEENNKARVNVPPHADQQMQALLQSHHEHMKSRVAFSVHSDSVSEGYGPHHVVRFPNIFTNMGGLFDGMSNLGELTIRKAGLYHLSVHVVATDGGDSALLTLKHNGHAILHSKPLDTTTSNYILPTGAIQTVLNLEAGDTIQLSVEKVTNESRTSPSDVIFNGYLIN